MMMVMMVVVVMMMMMVSMVTMVTEVTMATMVTMVTMVTKVTKGDEGDDDDDIDDGDGGGGGERISLHYTSDPKCRGWNTDLCLVVQWRAQYAQPLWFKLKRCDSASHGSGAGRALGPPATAGG